MSDDVSALEALILGGPSPRDRFWWLFSFASYSWLDCSHCMCMYMFEACAHTRAGPPSQRPRPANKKAPREPQPRTLSSLLHVHLHVRG